LIGSVGCYSSTVSVMKYPICTLFLLFIIGKAGVAQNTAAPAMFDTNAAERFAHLALACVHKEYPNHITHTLNSDADVAPPRKLTPAFYGCYDWHSSVHGHWLLARLIGTFPNSAFAPSARETLRQSLTAENIAQEAVYLRAEGRASFERPYGAGMATPACRGTARMGRPSGPRDGCEPAAFLPQISSAKNGTWLQPVVSPDPTDPKLAHLDGLNLSRAWMLEGMAAGLPKGDKRPPTIRAAAEEHRRAGLAAVTGKHYEGGHWLGSFAVYLVTGRGIPQT